MIEVGQVACFLAVVEEESFTLAAKQLGLAQSATSQKLKRLEDQLGIKLVERTSRSVRISEDGKRFMPFARKMLEAEENARDAALDIAKVSARTLRLGSYSFSIDDRTAVIEHVLLQDSNILFEVHHGTRSEMLSKLEKREVDAFLSLSFVDQKVPEYNDIIIRRLHGHVRLPTGHRLANQDSIAIADLSGEKFAISPGRQDMTTLNWVYEHLTRKGVILVPAPEAARGSITMFAKVNDLPSLQWFPSTHERTVGDGGVILPIDNNRLFLEVHVYTLPSPRRKVLDDFCRILMSIPQGSL